MDTFSVINFFHQDTSSWTHILVDLETRYAAIIDPVLDYRPEDGTLSSQFADGLLDYVAREQLTIKYLFDTHIHADHLTAASYLRDKCAAPIVIGKNVCLVQQKFSEVFNESKKFAVDGSQFDRLVDEDEVLELGNTRIRILNTPGHTPACISLLVNEQAVFVGDTLFMPDVGSARCDFPDGDAATLYESVHKLYQLADDVVMYLCHDYPPSDRAVAAKVTVREQKQHNIHLNMNVELDQFVEQREQRDATLAKPRLMLPALQINIRAGSLPYAEDNGVAYLKVPINFL